MEEEREEGREQGGRGRERGNGEREIGLKENPKDKGVKREQSKESRPKHHPATSTAAATRAIGGKRL